MEFLRDVTEGAGKTIIHRCLTDEELLQTQPLEQVPDEHKPDDEWIAARLKIPNEFKKRLAAKVQRKMKRKMKHGFYKMGDEVWMHCKPDGAELRNWRILHRCTFGSDADAGREEEVKLHEERKTESDSEDASAAASQVTDEPRQETGATSQESWLGCPPALKSDSGTDDERPTLQRK